jgi:hypothetical protein
MDEVRSKMIMSVTYDRQSAIELNYFTLFLGSLAVLGCGGLMVLPCLWFVKLLAVPVCSCLHHYISSLVTAWIITYLCF